MKHFQKNEVVNALNKKNYNNLASKDNIDILDYKASLFLIMKLRYWIMQVM